MPTRIVVNVQTGERQQVEMSAEEISQAAERVTAMETALASAQKSELESLKDRVAALEAAKP